MGIVSALYTGATGMRSFATAIQVIGNNLANSNTNGFKASRAQFADLIYQNITGANNQVGLGTRVQSISKNFSQGALTTTGNTMDMGIEGNGFFLVRDGAETMYTRDGQFRLDNTGNLVNSLGYAVQGYLYDDAGNFTPATGAINLSELISQPRSTTQASLNLNLNSDEQILGAFDPADPAANSNYSTTLTIYDSLGENHEMTVFFRKDTDLNWEWHAMVPMSDIDPASTELWYEGAGGTLTFDGTGALASDTVTTNDFSFANGATPGQTVSFDFGQSIADGGTGLSGTTQFASANSVTYNDQDGYSAGNLVSFDVDPEGVITGLFTNGNTRPIAQVLLATFSNNHGLNAIGNNLFTETTMSGQPIIQGANTGAAGLIYNATLELSNVDIANEFVAMIQNQRGYQANSRTVTVGDTLLQETINMIR